MTEKYEYCITVPRIFVPYCRNAGFRWLPPFAPFYSWLLSAKLP